MSQAPDELRARIAAIKARMTGEAAPAAPTGGAAPAAPAAAAPAAGAAAGGDMAARVAAIKAKMAGGAAPAAAPAAAAAKPAAAAAPAAAAPAASEGDMAARVAALKAKMEAGKGAPAAARPAAAASPGSATVAAPAKPAPAKAPAGKPIWPVQPIDRTSFGEERLYPPGTLARWFSLGGVLLVVSVIIMLRHDWVRDWKDFQSEFREEKIKMGQAAVEAANAAIDQQKLAEVEAEEKAAGAEVAARSADLQRLQKEWEAIDAQLFRDEQEYKFKKSEFDAQRYEYEELRVQQGGNTAVLAESDAHMTAMKAELERLQSVYDVKYKEREDKKAEMDAMTARETAARKALAALTEQRDMAAARLERIDHNLFNDFIRNAPIADMLAPTLKIDQIVLERLKDNYNFMYVGKIDRCTTCHVGIDDPAFSGADWNKPGKRVFMAHPRLDLFVSDNSPHPKGEFGCTVCHQGRGQAVEFPRTFHVPTADAFETEAQKAERWTKDYGYDSHRHYWDFPMVPSNMLYSSCNQCHQQTDRIQGVPEYNDSRALVEDLGCYGCHKVDGMQHLRKPGPDLTNIAAKTTEDWARKWVEAPKAFRPTTRMPHFFNQSNTGGRTDAVITGDLHEVRDDRHPWNNDKDRWVDDYRGRNAVEVRAIVAYVFGLSRQAQAKNAYVPAAAPNEKGDAARGKELFVSRGCLGCHSVAREDMVEAKHGPDLSSIGSKVNGAWLYDWIQNPRHYFPTTVMPDLRLTDEEAADITAWLLTGRDAAWEALPQPAANEKILDSIALEYLSAAAGEEVGKTELARMRGQGGASAVEQFVGGRLFARYGCSGCHLAPGHENDTGVGTELTKEGLKELSKFDFGFEADVHNPEAIPFTRHDFFRAKLKDPRVFDRLPIIVAGASEHGGGHAATAHGRIERYDEKIKSPGDKLKMPNFYLSDDEVELVTQWLMGLREDGIDATMKRTLTADEKVQEHASRLITERNCTGCHQLGQLSRPIVPDEDNVSADAWMAEELLVMGPEGRRNVLGPGSFLMDEIYDPWEEEDADTLEFLEAHPPAAPVLVYGLDEGGIGKFIDQAAMRPPILRQEGFKVNPNWLFGFLIEPFTVRTHIDVRMPTFGFNEAESQALARWFAAQADQPWPFQSDKDVVLDQELLDRGQEIFAKNQCNSCHPAGGKDPPNPDKANWGPDLALAKARLKGDWISEWLKAPPSFQPGTKMPSYFGEWKDNEYDVFVKDWEDQVRALRHFLKHMDEAAPEEKPVSMGEK
jgi:cbb3-type cytochrome oxidase cytochrome c subunit